MFSMRAGKCKLQQSSGAQRQQCKYEYLISFCLYIGLFQGAQPVAAQAVAGAAPFSFQCLFVSVSPLLIKSCLQGVRKVEGT